MKPDEISAGWYEMPGWTITWERKGGYRNCPASGWYVHPAFGSEGDCDSLGPFRTLKAACEAVQQPRICKECLMNMLRTGDDTVYAEYVRSQRGEIAAMKKGRK